MHLAFRLTNLVKLASRNKIYTRTGDKATAQLFSGERRDKTDSIFDALGNTDELNASLGLVILMQAYSYCKHQDLRNIIEFLQCRLIDVGACIATPIATSNQEKLNRTQFSQEYTNQLENWIDKLEESLPPLSNFILPSGGQTASSLHLSRAICRRAERSIAVIMLQNGIDGTAYRFMNRMSDLLFVMARSVAQREGIEERPYKKEQINQNMRRSKQQVGAVKNRSLLGTQSSSVGNFTQRKRTSFASGLNFMRVGSPSSVVIHVPRHIAVLKQEASTDLTKLGPGLDSIIDFEATKRSQRPLPKVDPKYFDSILKLDLPIKSFDEVPLPRKYYTLIKNQPFENEFLSVILDTNKRRKSRINYEPPKQVQFARQNMRNQSRQLSSIPIKTELNEMRQKPYNKLNRNIFKQLRNQDIQELELQFTANQKLVHVRNSVYETPLHCAVQRNNLLLAQLLIKYKADINAIDISHRTPLYIAARKDNYKLIKLLLKNGADPTIKSKNNKTPLELLPQGSPSHYAISKHLNNKNGQR